MCNTPTITRLGYDTGSRRRTRASGRAARQREPCRDAARLLRPLPTSGSSPEREQSPAVPGAGREEVRCSPWPHSRWWAQPWLFICSAVTSSGRWKPGSAQAAVGLCQPAGHCTPRGTRAGSQQSCRRLSAPLLRRQGEVWLGARSHSEIPHHPPFAGKKRN